MENFWLIVSGKNRLSSGDTVLVVFYIVTLRATLFGMLELLIAHGFMDWDRQSLFQTLISPDLKMVPQQ